MYVYYAQNTAIGVITLDCLNASYRVIRYWDLAVFRVTINTGGRLNNGSNVGFYFTFWFILLTPRQKSI
jgi:hypothetical protein